MNPAAGVVTKSSDGFSARARAAASVAALGCAAGLLSGSLHALVLLVLRFAIGRLTFYSRDAVWMAPLASALLFGAIAFGLAVLSGLLRIRIPLFLAAGFFSFLGVFSLLVPFPAVARWAAALLALAVGLQIARGWRRAPERWERGTVRGGLAIAVAIAVLGLGQELILALRRAAARRGLTPVGTTAPNVLLVILDTVRGEELSLYGYSRPTSPALEKWAARGAVFDQAIATAPWTQPSHGSLFTGELGDRLGGGWFKPLQFSVPTLAETLRRQGYRTGGFAANLLYTSYESGLTRGFIDYQDYPRSLHQLFLHCPIVQTGLFQSLVKARSLYELRHGLMEFKLQVSAYPSDEYVSAQAVTDRFLRWQAGVAGRPFFAFLNYFDAHAPYRSPPAFRARLAASGKPRDRYDAAIAYLDSELDRLLRTLDQRGVLDRTIVVVAADHGEHFGEHGLKGHANSLYLPLLRVPLVLLYPPRVPAGVRVPGPVSLRRVPATILELAGGTPSGTLPGTSLVSSWDSTREGARSDDVIAQVIRSRERNPKFPNDRTGLASVLDDRYHYIRSGLGQEELYAWRSDPLELRDLSRSPGEAAILRGLRERLDQAAPLPHGSSAGQP